MGILFANNVNMQLAADLAADDTSFSVIAGQGSQCPEIATDSTDYMFLKIRNKNGLDEIVKIIEHELNSDTFIIGDSTEVPHTPSTDGRAYEKTFGGYQTALAITASDKHKITMPVTAATLEDALVVAGSGATTDDFEKLHDITSSATEINQLHESGVVKADLEKLHALTSTHTEINQLHESGVVKADFERLHGITVPATQINTIGKIKVKACRGTWQDFPANTSTKLLLQTVSFDPEGVVDLGNSRIVPNLPGYYIVFGSISLYEVPEGAMFTARILRNNSLVANGSCSTQGASGENPVSQVQSIVYMDGDSDYLELGVWNNSSSALHLYNFGSVSNYLSIIGPF